MNLKRLHEKIDFLIEQEKDLSLLLEFKDLRYDSHFKLTELYQRTYLNFRQRQRFIAASFARNYIDYLSRTYVVEKR